MRRWAHPVRYCSVNFSFGKDISMQLTLQELLKFVDLLQKHPCLPLWGRWLSFAKPERVFFPLSVKNQRFLPALP